MRQDCHLLVECLAAMHGIPPEQGQDAFAGHLAETRVLERRIAACVGQLNAGRGEVKRLPAPLRDEVEACIAEARDRLQAGAGAYGGLAADVTEALAAIRQRLDAIRQGSRVLRGYSQAAR